jgi:hypothetical protein
MTGVAVRIFHPEPAASAGPLERELSAARLLLAGRHVAAFGRAGAQDVEIVAGAPEDTPFGARLRALVAAERPDGLVLLGSGALPVATVGDLRLFVETASAGRRVALANNRYSADAVAVGCAESLLALPDLPSDNALPRWLEEVAGYEVRDLARRWRLAIDLDSPLDLALVGEGEASIRDRLAQVATVARDRRAELLVAGRTSAATMRWLERRVPARVRILAEERGLRASSHLALRGDAPRRPPRSVLGLVLDRDGPEALGSILADLADAALVDSRVLIAHRVGADEARWPRAEDRFASDLLVADAIRDPWLRALTESARTAPIPVVLGGHSLVGPGIRLALRSR